MIGTMTRRAMAAGLLALLASGGAARAADRPVIHVVRHFDTPAGERDPDLTGIGAARAAALAGWFKGKPLRTIYVTPFKRTAQTVAPLAADHGLVPVPYGPAPSADFLEMVKGAPGPILIVGHSNTVPDIVAALGGVRPAAIEHGDFGEVWTIDAGGTTSARIAP